MMINSNLNKYKKECGGNKMTTRKCPDKQVIYTDKFEEGRYICNRCIYERDLLEKGYLRDPKTNLKL